MTEAYTLSQGDKNFPERLSLFLGNKCPRKISFRGNLNLLDRAGLGFCGSRKATELGLEMATDFANFAVENDITVISGNASGVDFATHHAALASGGSTIMVLPEGMNHFTIKKGLKEVWDWERVLVISQFNDNAPWRAYQAMERNKLIITLSSTVIVIEAGEKGGTFNAGVETLKFGIPLFVSGDLTIGNQFLLESGGLKVATRSSSPKVDMSVILEAIRSDKGLSMLAVQESLF
ncbi:MAG: hypothetical protein CMF62_04380 [Magnetococcales bacterium]|nr:hypothetical protein [Magnetococcales bacterium]|tara:strand:- start:16490 stop:17194 length:705 start_codon:yes stop_codon:yes gene_type:complete